jgi:transcription termination factor NusB
MRTIATCPVCIEAQAKSGAKPAFKPLSGELDDCGYIHVNCDQGHYGIAIYDARRYEVLIESAAKAYVDGYTNEVVAVMSAALERTYEFYIRVSCRAKGISSDAFESAWKGISSQSERQFGAFQFLYLIDHGESFKLDKTITETRNSIVHKGRIAREGEALSFAENVFKHVRVIENSIKSKFSQYADEESTHELETQKALVPQGVASITLKKHTVRVDTTKNEVVGIADCFLDMAGAILQSRSRGFPT